MAGKLRVAIDCRIGDPMQGIGTAVLALAKALSDSGAAKQEYTFIVRAGLRDWLAPYIYGPCKLEAIPDPVREPMPVQAKSLLSPVKAALRQIQPLRRAWHKLRGAGNSAVIEQVPARDHYAEALGFDLVHFPTQLGYVTELPTIYQPWDLQHLHYPQFFSSAEMEWREKMYRTCCARASYVCVQTAWTKQDVVRNYDIPEEKVVVIPWGCAFDAYARPSKEERLATIERFHLSNKFFFYPAATWRHKNHEVIFRALSILKREGRVLPDVVFTGADKENRPILDELAKELGVAAQVRFLGIVSPKELQAITASAAAMIFPSKFEGFGLPILEAFHAQLPVLSSNATTLPEVARDGALYFDPDSPDELAALMRMVMEDTGLREELIKRGNLTLPNYSMSKTAAEFQDLYEKTAEKSQGPTGALKQREASSGEQ
jgi:glycosyltransferase involved in cell wall biosynthesis